MIDTLVVPGLSESDNEALNQCLSQLNAVSWINLTRQRYFECKQLVRQLGIAIPPQLASFETVMGWPYKAVKSLASRIKLGGFAIPGEDAADFGLDRIWAENRLGIEAHHAHMSALTYGVSFVAVMAGGEGEPAAVVRTLSPTSSTALWDANRRRASAALSVVSQESGHPTEFILYLADKIVTAKFERGRWSVEDAPHSLGRCPVVVLAYDSSPEYPFGRSRITQGVMRITDEAIRTSLRMEVSAEFYSSPQRYLLGANEEAFVGPNGEKKTQWDAVLGRMLAIGKDEDGDIPTVGQFPQMSMQPHVEMLRTIAAKFAGETSIPVNALGIIHDNPASDAAMHTAYLELNSDAESAHEPFGAAWVDAMRMAVQIAGGSDEGLELLTTKWRDPSTPTKAAAADAVMKLVTAGVLPPDSAVTLEQLGFDQTTIDRIVADRRRSAVSQLVSGIGARLDAAEASPEVQAVAAERGSGDA
ncbi:phage portal protein [Arthrobacter frigidicola]|nr:phage portal protein [Arthrobacter frigidicola]